jgi:hypothetical protein
LQAWLEEGGVNAVIKAVEEAGVLKKALGRGISSLLRGPMRGGRASSTRYKYESSAELIWPAYILNVGKEPLIRSSTTPLLVNLQEVGASEGIPAFGIHVVKDSLNLPSRMPRILAIMFSVGAQVRLYSKELKVQKKSGQNLLHM